MLLTLPRLDPVLLRSHAPKSSVSVPSGIPPESPQRRSLDDYDITMSEIEELSFGDPSLYYGITLPTKKGAANCPHQGASSMLEPNPARAQAALGGARDVDQGLLALQVQPPNPVRAEMLRRWAFLLTSDEDSDYATLAGLPTAVALPVPLPLTHPDIARHADEPTVAHGASPSSSSESESDPVVLPIGGAQRRVPTFAGSSDDTGADIHTSSHEYESDL